MFKGVPVVMNLGCKLVDLLVSTVIVHVPPVVLLIVSFIAQNVEQSRDNCPLPFSLLIFVSLPSRGCSVILHAYAEL